MSALDLRSASACALPRPSATASARFAKITVSQSQNTVSQANQLLSPTASTVDQTAPISTMNITGLRHRVRGSSLRTASGSAFSSMARVEQARPAASRRERGRYVGAGWNRLWWSSVIQ